MCSVAGSVIVGAVTTDMETLQVRCAIRQSLIWTFCAPTRRSRGDRTRILLTVVAVAALCVVWSAAAHAQRAVRVGVSGRAVNQSGQTGYSYTRYVPRDVAESAYADSANGFPAGAIGAVTGAVLGGVLGYRWEMALCEKPAAQCTGKQGAVGGAVVGAVVGFAIDWGFRGLHDRYRHDIR
jgi:hypothetical protein